MIMVAAISTISARDPDGVTLRIGMILVTVGAAMWLPWQALLPAVLVAWLGPNIGRGLIEDYELFNTNMMWELPGLIGLAAFSSFARVSLRELEEEHLLLGLGDGVLGLDAATGVFDENQLRISIEAEVSRSRRFERTFSLVLVGIDEMRQRFDYRDDVVWDQSFKATADLLRNTRHNVDRVYRYGATGFAMILPESGPSDVNGMVRRLRRIARKSRPSEGEPGGPLPAHFGATFFPSCATSTDDLLRRAEVVLRIADKNTNRVQLDGAEAPEMPPAETLRQAEALEDVEDETLAAEALPEPIQLPVPAILRHPAFAAEERSEPLAPPQPLFPDQVEVAEVPLPVTGEPAAGEPEPAVVYAVKAPEPPVSDHVAPWQSEAPLSVLPQPHPRSQLAAVPEASQTGDAIDASVNDALKRLDETLELIRSLKKRSA
jgi:diguanylate cyclase (GGDEF)-like protein